MTTRPDNPASATDSFDYCRDFWEGALDAEDEIDHFVREARPHGPRHADRSEDMA
jgi:hypothetical protein